MGSVRGSGEVKKSSGVKEVGAEGAVGERRTSITSEFWPATW